MALTGQFEHATGQPHIEGRLILARLNIRDRISFLVDTGADSTLLMPEDGLAMHLDYGQLTGSAVSMGIGGISRDFLEPALVSFEDRGNVYFYVIDIFIAPPTPEIRSIPSVLGRNILNRWDMIYRPSKNRLSFRVVSADYTFPITTT